VPPLPPSLRPCCSYLLVEKKVLFVHLFLLNNILTNLFVVQKNFKGSNAPNGIIVQFEILLIKEKIDNSISYHASTKAICFGGPI